METPEEFSHGSFQYDREEMMEKFVEATKLYLQSLPGNECLLAHLGNSDVKFYLDWFKANTNNYCLRSLLQKYPCFEIRKNDKLADVVKLIDTTSISQEMDLDSVVKKYFDSVKQYLSATGSKGKCLMSKLDSTEPMKTYSKYLKANLPSNKSVLALFKERSKVFRIIQNPADENNFVVTLSKPKAEKPPQPKTYEEYKQFSLRKAKSLMSLGDHSIQPGMSCSKLNTPQLDASKVALSSSMTNLQGSGNTRTVPPKKQLVDAIYDMLLKSSNNNSMLLTEVQNKSHIQKIWNAVIKEEPTIKFVTFLQRHFDVERTQDGMKWVIYLPENEVYSDVTSNESGEGTTTAVLLDTIDSVFKQEGNHALRLQIISGHAEVCRLWQEVAKDIPGDKKFLGFLKEHYKMERTSDSWMVFPNKELVASAHEKLYTCILGLFKERKTECLLIDNISPTATESMKKLWACIRKTDPHLKYIDFVSQYFDVNYQSGEKPKVYLKSSGTNQNVTEKHSQTTVRKKSNENNDKMISEYVEGNFISAVVEFLNRNSVQNISIGKLYLMDDNIKSAWECYNQQASHPRKMKEVLLKYPTIFRIGMEHQGDCRIELVQYRQPANMNQMQRKDVYRSFQDLSLNDIIASQTSVSHAVNQDSANPGPTLLSSNTIGNPYTVSPYTQEAHSRPHMDSKLTRSASIGSLVNPRVFNRGASSHVYRPSLQDNFENNVRSAINDVFTQDSSQSRSSANPALPTVYHPGFSVSYHGSDTSQGDMDQQIARLKENLDNYCALKGIRCVDVVFTRLGEQKICNVNLNHVTIGEHSAPSKEEAACTALLQASQWLIDLFVPL